MRALIDLQMENEVLFRSADPGYRKYLLEETDPYPPKDLEKHRRRSFPHDIGNEMVRSLVPSGRSTIRSVPSTALA